MKREEIILDPHEKNIILGIFDTSTFNWFMENKPVIEYSTFSEWLIELPGECYDIINYVEHAAQIAKKIVFVMDDIHFPLNIPDSYTCAELDLICHREDLFNKTIFVKGENIVTFDKNLVI